MKYNSDYDIRLKMLESLGGDVTKKYDSVYSIDLEILRLMEEGGGGGGGGTSSKVVRIGDDWYIYNDRYQTEIKNALDEIYNEISNNRSVTVIFNGYSSQPAFLFQTNNVVSTSANFVQFSALGTNNWFLSLKLSYDARSNRSKLDAIETQLVSKNQILLPYVYTDGQLKIDTNEGRISEFISEPTVDNEEFVVIKTTVPAYTGTDSPNNQIYKALRDNYGNRYLLSKFGGMKLWRNEYDANFDLIPDGEWYVIFGDIGAATYRRIIVTKAVRNEDKTLDVYLGFKGIDLNSIGFYDCTVDNRDNQGEQGIWNERNWVKVSDAENISVDSFIGRRTRYFCVNTEGTKVDRLVLFKRMK